MGLTIRPYRVIRSTLDDCFFWKQKEEKRLKQNMQFENIFLHRIRKAIKRNLSYSYFKRSSSESSVDLVKACEWVNKENQALLVIGV